MVNCRNELTCGCRDVRVRPGVKLKSVDLRINLESLSFYLKNVEDGTCGG